MLTELDLGRNYLTVLPEGIWNLTNLIKLNICGNKLNELSSEIHNLKSLIELNVRQNNFYCITKRNLYFDKFN